MSDGASDKNSKSLDSHSHRVANNSHSNSTDIDRVARERENNPDANDAMPAR